MILALGDFLINRETKHARGPGFNSQLAPLSFFTIRAEFFCLASINPTSHANERSKLTLCTCCNIYLPKE
ncbi:CGH_3_HP_G0026660.mRNA.1.CDS.1 [Saccharomyces cerevisiae]|nr:CGH_3_HP_G0026660.mRNA.1.CDS.1 [Saccharomyces cerevisiae]CAI5024429.1 CGH_1_HP_G0096010.mRNA.1.CDS.1 [Saccharomyces cerevisiae]CAI6442809.1 CGH_3_HP_G0026660.mRNA.1.CDS.1 [Saccharomyces cerevisiae]CAI6942391.1 CGH_1_HP_G0096010.mRNA.1.CDS.1 [Saccharomyces cerevisiae]